MKRFTDTELAVEYHAAAADAFKFWGSTRRSGKTHARDVAMTLYRFATHPHALEAPDVRE